MLCAKSHSCLYTYNLSQDFPELSILEICLSEVVTCLSLRVFSAQDQLFSSVSTTTPRTQLQPPPWTFSSLRATLGLALACWWLHLPLQLLVGTVVSPQCERENLSLLGCPLWSPIPSCPSGLRRVTAVAVCAPIPNSPWNTMFPGSTVSAVRSTWLRK